MKTLFRASLWRSLLVLAIGSASVAAAELRIVAPSAPGSGWDRLARAMKTALGTASTTIEVVNVPGGGGTVGLGQFLADPVEHQLLVTGLGMVDAILLKHAPIALDRMTPIARLCVEHYFIVVPAGSPIRNFGELRAAFQSNPSKVTWAGGPAGGIDHVAAALFARAAGVEPQALNYVPFLTTGDAVGATIERKVTAALLPRVDLDEALKDGTVRVLAVAASNRLESIAAPTLREDGLEFEFANWRGVVAKPGIDQAERASLTALVVGMVSSGNWKDIVERGGWEPAFLPPGEFAAFIAAEQARVKGALTATGTLKPNSD